MSQFAFGPLESLLPVHPISECEFVFLSLGSPAFATVRMCEAASARPFSPHMSVHACARWCTYRV